MLAACIYAVTQSKWNQHKAPIVLVDVGATILGLFASIIAYSRIEAFIVHQMLIVLDVFLFINLLSVTLYWFHEEVCLYVLLFDGALFITHFVYQIIILCSKATTSPGGMAYTMLVFGYPLYMITCFILSWRVLSNIKQIH